MYPPNHTPTPHIDTPHTHTVNWWLKKIEALSEVFRQPHVSDSYSAGMNSELNFLSAPTLGVPEMLYLCKRSIQVTYRFVFITDTRNITFTLIPLNSKIYHTWFNYTWGFWEAKLTAAVLKDIVADCWLSSPPLSSNLLMCWFLCGITYLYQNNSIIISDVRVMLFVCWNEVICSFLFSVDSYRTSSFC